jgi:hypothetical protein
MKNRPFFFAAIVLLALTEATAAHAGPVAAFVAAVVAIVGIKTVIAVAIQLGIAIIQSVLAKQQAKKARTGGIQIEYTRQGGANSRTILFGLYATAGQEVCPPMSHGIAGKTPNAYLTKIIALSDFLTTDLEAVILQGERIVPNKASSTEYGWSMTGKYAGKAWVKFYDGRQTTADPMLLAKYAGYIRPWTAAHVGKGVSYVICTFKYDDELFKSEPDMRFEVRGAPMYDVRKDSTAGGVGSHRWDDQLTWQYTENPIIMSSNVLRGIVMAGDQRYGGPVPAASLPLDNWAAAMNVCDETVTVEGGGTEPRYRAGFEAVVAEDQPVETIEEFMKACSASMTEIGGTYKVRAGPPSLPVMFITDKDIVVSREQEFNPIAAISDTVNALYGTFPHPGELWGTHDAPAIIDPVLLARDDNVEHPSSVTLSSVPFPVQVQRLMKAWLIDNQRWRQHNFTLGPYGFPLEPLDVISWSSARNGYADKQFEVDFKSENLTTLAGTVAIREVDPADYDWEATDQVADPVSPGEWVQPAVQAVPGWAVTAVALKDADGTDRRPAIGLEWTPDAAEDAKLLAVQIRLAETGVIVTDMTITNIAAGETVVSEGVLPATSYEARAKYTVDRPTDWSSWLGVTTLNVKMTDADVDITVTFPDGSSPIWNYDTPDDLPAVPAEDQTTAYVETGPDGQPKLYKWNPTANAWQYLVPTIDLSGQILNSQIVDEAITKNKFASGIQPVGVGATLPTLPNSAWPNGSQYILTSDSNKTYTNNAGEWSKDIDAGDLTGTISSGMIPGLDASKIVSGQFTDVRIADAAIIAAKLATGAVTTPAIVAGAVVASKLTLTDVRNLVPDPALMDFDAWLQYSGTGAAISPSGNDPTVWGSDRVFYQPSQVAASDILSKPFLVTPGEELRTTLILGVGPGSHGWTVYLIWYDGVASANAGGYPAASVVTSGSTGWGTKVGANNLVPTNANFARLLMRRDGGDDGNALYWSSPIISRRNGAELIVDGAIITDKLAANSVVTSKILAGAVTASRLTVTDIRNLIPDANVEDKATWSFDYPADVGFFSDAPSATYGSNRYMVVGPNAALNAVFSGKFPVTPGDELLVGFNTWGDGTDATYDAWVFYYDSDARAFNAWQDAQGGTIWTIGGAVVSRKFSVGVPAGMSHARLVVRRRAGGTSVVGISVPYVYRKNGAELIVDGAIITDKLSANAVTTGKLAVGAVVADRIAASAVNAEKMSVGSNDNLIPNADAEENNGPSISRISFVGGGAYTGSRVYRTTQTGAAYDALMFTDAFAVKPGDQFYVEAMTLSGGAVTLAAVRMMFVLTDGSVAYPVDSRTNAPSGAWHKEYGYFTAPANAKQAQIYFETNGTGAYDVWIDALYARRRMTGELIVDGAITADKVAANSITTGKLFVTGQGRALNDDPRCMDRSAWAPAANVTVVPIDGGPAGNSALLVTSQGAIEQIKKIVVEGGKRYRVSAWVLVDINAGSNFYMRLECFNTAGTNIAYQLTPPVEGATITTGAWHKMSGWIDVPNGSDYALLRAYCNWSGGSVTRTWVQDFRVEEYVGGDLIVDGTILTNHLAANSVDANKITAGAVTAAKINVTNLAAINADLGAVTAGSLNINGKFIVATDGTTTIQNATSGARLVIKNDTIKVYDSSGVVRVHIGDLSA